MLNFNVIQGFQFDLFHRFDIADSPGKQISARQSFKPAAAIKIFISGRELSFVMAFPNFFMQISYLNASGIPRR